MYSNSSRRGARILVAALTALLFPGTPALACEQPGERTTSPRVGVVWFAVDLPPSCAIDVARVEHEVRRIFDAMGVGLDWKAPTTAVIDNHGEIVVVALHVNSRKRPLILGATTRGSNSAWVYCSEIARAAGVGPNTPGAAFLLSRAVGRVVAHEITHVLAPSLPHAREGLMAARWAPARLRDPVLLADEGTRLAVLRRLASTVALARP